MSTQSTERHPLYFAAFASTNTSQLRTLIRGPLAAWPIR